MLVSRITFTVEVTCPEDYSRQTVASAQSCLRHFDLAGKVSEAVRFGALMEPVNQTGAYHVNVSVKQEDA
jgi:hypothetical protein